MAVLFCHLAEIMERGNLTIEDVCRLCKVHRSVVVSLRLNSFQKISRSVLVRICKGLDVSLDELFSMYDEDPLFPVRMHRQLTIHVGCNTFKGGGNGPGAIGRHYYSSWDVNASIELRDTVDRSEGSKVSVAYHGHDLGIDTDERAIDRAFDGGDHVILGSPVSNRFTEYVVCRMFGVPPFTATERKRFPANFVLDSAHSVPSSLCYQGQGKQFGIMSTETGRMIAEHTLAVLRGHSLNPIMLRGA